MPFPSRPSSISVVMTCGSLRVLLWTWPRLLKRRARVRGPPWFRGKHKSCATTPTCPEVPKVDPEEIWTQDIANDAKLDPTGLTTVALRDVKNYSGTHIGLSLQKRTQVRGFKRVSLLCGHETRAIVLTTPALDCPLSPFKLQATKL